jgi:CheY-like chemotaxis protein
MPELVLIAEDEEADAIMLKRALSKINQAIVIHIVPNGDEAISYLSGEGQYADRKKFPFPAIVLLDLKMPRKSGFEVLAWIKDNPRCLIVPTIVWSSSSLPQDVLKAYSLGANCYLVKPNSFDAIQRLILRTFEFWEMCQKPMVE